MSSSCKLLIAWADAKAARYACKHWHYSRTLPPGTANLVDVWEDDVFIGVVAFARGASPHLGTPFGLDQTECCELVRIALRAHQTPVSRIMKLALKLLRQRSPGIKMVISFADREQGHHGGVYQAGGWIYTGTSADSFAFVDKRGRRWHQRQVTASGFGREFGVVKRCAKRDEVTKIKLLGKYRYLMPLDADVRARVIGLAQAYPKRETPPACVGSAESGTPSVQLGRAGAVPSTTLHKRRRQPVDVTAL